MISVCRRRSVGSERWLKCSVKSVSSVRERNILCERRNSPATFVVNISSRGCVLFLTEEHRRTEHTKAHKDSGPSPDLSPGGKGSDHRDTPIRRISALCCPLLVSTIVLTFCEFCMPEAFCEFETVRKWVLLNLCVLWEKEISFVKEKTPQRIS